MATLLIRMIVSIGCFRPSLYLRVKLSKKVSLANVGHNRAVLVHLEHSDSATQQWWLGELAAEFA